MSEKVFRQLPPQRSLKKLQGEPTPKLMLAGGQLLPVRNRYVFKIRIGNNFPIHELYVIPELNKPLILDIDFILKHQLWYCPKNNTLRGKGSPTGAIAILKSPQPPPFCPTRTKCDCIWPMTDWQFFWTYSWPVCTRITQSPTKPPNYHKINNKRIRGFLVFFLKCYKNQ